MTAGRQDEAVDVRQACVRALARCKVDTPAVLDALKGLAQDPTPAVRAEAANALTRMRPGAR